MPEYRIVLDAPVGAFYARVAADAGLSTEQVLADALFRLAGELSLQALHNARRPASPQNESRIP